MAAPNPYSPATHVLDTSAILAVFLNEEGADFVRAAGPDGLISAVNWSEVVAKMSDRGSPPALTLGRLEALALHVAPFGRAQARQAGELRRATRERNVSFADRACLSLGIEAGLPVVTGDRDWTDLGLDVELRMIR